MQKRFALKNAGTAGNRPNFVAGTKGQAQGKRMNA
jgi:hypothetical protein